MENQEDLVCPECGAKYKARYSLARHRRRSHGFFVRKARREARSKEASAGPSCPVSSSGDSGPMYEDISDVEDFGLSPDAVLELSEGLQEYFGSDIPFDMDFEFPPLMPLAESGPISGLTTPTSAVSSVGATVFDPGMEPAIPISAVSSGGTPASNFDVEPGISAAGAPPVEEVMPGLSLAGLTMITSMAVGMARQSSLAQYLVRVEIEYPGCPSRVAAAVFEGVRKVIPAVSTDSEVIILD